VDENQAVQERKRRAKTVPVKRVRDRLKAQAGWEDLSEDERAQRMREALERLDEKR